MSKDLKNPAVNIREAARLSGLKTHMITYLARTDILRPSRGGGRGTPRLFTFNDVIFLRVIADLLSRGIEVARLRVALKRARDETETWIDIRRSPARYLVTDGTEVFIRRRGDLESKNKTGQLAFAFVLDLGLAHKKIASEWSTQERPRQSDATAAR